ncbi:MAG: OmpA family protein [Gammaproteobacteria bacterium]|nr:OmpA family protein [Gammaproteobacteria bacterium]
MNAHLKILLVAPMALLAACATQTQKQYESCVVASMAAGGGAGGAISGGVGAVPGIAVGALASQIFCQQVKSTPEVVAAAPAPVATAPADSDRDGVTDDRDRCPNTPAGTRVDRNGCPLDSDNDGVADYQDSCPNTPAGTRVDGRGCPVVGEKIVTLSDVNFAFDSARLRLSEAEEELDAAIEAVKSSDVSGLDLVGHTDSVGSDAYNQGLSERRARSVRDYLVEHGVNASMLRVVGRGESEPTATNDTEEGRAENRRVEFIKH